jgi:CDP-glycerol glycerophosphotransferase
MVLFGLSFVIPKRKKTILLGGGLGERFSGNPKYFFLYLLKLRSENPFEEYYWITKNRELFNELSTQGLPVIYSYSLKGFWKILRSEFLIIESGPAMKKLGHDIGYMRLFFGKFKIIQTWHGSPVKRILLDALKDRGLKTPIDYIYFTLEKLELKNIWFILAMGDREQKILQQAFNNKNVHILGYPKNDILVDGLEKWGYKKSWIGYEKVILYAPSFRDKKSDSVAFDKDSLITLNSFLKSKNWIFLIKKHPYDIYLDIPEGFSNIKDITKEFTDVQLVLAQTDLLITDYSSIYVDFLLRGKNILFYMYDINSYRANSREFYYNLEVEAVGEIAYSFNELFSLLKDIESSEREFLEKYKVAIEKFHKYRDSNSSERLMRFLIKESS